MKTLLMKFGGSSIGITPGITQLLSSRWDQLVLVVSALEGITDQLIEASQFALMGNSRGYRRIVATIRTRHMSLVGDLPFGTNERNALQTDIDRILFDMHDACQQLSDAGERQNIAEIVDRIVGSGERLTARIIAALLRQNQLRAVALDATDLIITDEDSSHPSPLMALTQERVDERLKPLLNRSIIPVITGFIAATSAGAPTTLGRGGSDYTASLIAACIDASEVWIYADVDGMMSADPKEIPEARVIDTLSYREVAELAFFGARILHAHMIVPLQDRRIPLRIKNVFRPALRGTVIDDRPPRPGLKAVTVIEGLALSAPRSGSLSDMSRHIEEAFTKEVGGRIEAMITAQSANTSFVCFVVPTYVGPDAQHMLQAALAPTMTQIDTHVVWSMEPVGIVTAVGTGVGSDLPQIAQVFSRLAEVTLMAFSRNPSDCSLSLVVPLIHVEAAAQRIHDLIAP
ncbi:MAG: aspartate kinase [Chloroflexi bacterium]|nr:aspartate kinase [Chloroflexota bacterium]